MTAMEAGREFDAALAEMQQRHRRGRRSLDVDGWDAAAKTAALINVLMEGRVTPHDIDRSGIRGLRGDTWGAAREGPAREARARPACGGVGPRPRGPGEIPGTDLLATSPASGTPSCLTRTSSARSPSSRWLGADQTAYALLSDLVAVRRRP